jgi:hypothetical protein
MMDVQLLIDNRAVDADDGKTFERSAAIPSVEKR